MPMKVGARRQIAAVVRAAPFNPFSSDISLDNASIAENAGAWTVIGTPSVSVLPEFYVDWDVIDDGSGRFVIDGFDGDKLRLAWSRLDFVSATSYPVTIRAIAKDDYGVVSIKTKLFNISVTQSQSFANLATPLLDAFDFRRGITSSAGSITAIASQFGLATSINGYAANQPTLTQAGPVGGNAALIDNNQGFSGVTGITTSATFYYCGWHAFVAQATTPIVAQANNSVSQIALRNQGGGARLGLDGISYRSNVTGSNLTANFTTASLVIPLFTPGFLEVLCGTDHILRVFWNRVQMVAVDLSAENSGAGATWTITQLFKINALTHTAKHYWFGGGLGITVPSDNERDMLAAWGEGDRRHIRYLNSSTGSDASTTPWRAATPFKTLAGAGAVLVKSGVDSDATAGLWHGDWLGLDQFGDWRGEKIVTKTAGVSGAETMISGVDAAGKPLMGFLQEGQKPRLGSAGKPAKTVWTAAGTTPFQTWTQASATVFGGWAELDPVAALTTKLGLPSIRVDQYQRIAMGAVTGNAAKDAAWTLTQTGGVVTLSTDGTVDPNNINILLAINQNDTVTLALDYNNARQINVTQSGGVGISMAGGHNGQAYDCEMLFTLDDASANGSFERCNMLKPGQGQVTSGNGDCLTAHTSGLAQQGIVRRCRLVSGMSSFYAGLGAVWYWIDGCVFEGTSRYLVFPINDGNSGQIKLTNNVLPMGDDNLAGIGVDLSSSGYGATMQIIAYLNTIVYTGSATNGSGKTAFALLHGTAHEVWGNVVSNFGTGVSAGAGTVAADYNCWDNVGTPLNGVGITDGGHNISANPLFTDKAAGDYSLQSGSPCIGAAIGASSKATLDIRGRKRTADSNMGAYQRKVA